MELYTLLVESVLDYAIFALDPDGRITTWSRGAEHLKGYSEAEILGHHYGIFYTESERAAGAPERQLEIAAREGRYETRGWRVRKDGSRFWARAVITALRDDAGALIGFGKISTDLTAEQRAETELRQRERQLAEAQQIAHMGSWEWHIDEDRVEWSDELYRIYGLEPGTPVDYERYLSQVHPEDRDRVARVVAHALETGEPFVHEARILRASGEVRWAQARGEAVRDERGRVVQFHGTSLDITELKEAEAQARRLVAERSARGEAERTALRMGFLAEASALLGASLDYEETLRTIAWLAVPSFADWCAVDMVGPRGRPDRLAVAHLDPERVERSRALDARFPVDLSGTHGVARVLRTGEPELLEEITPEVLAAAATSEEHRRELEALELRSAMTVPIQVRERTLGAITFVHAESGRRYAPEDFVVAQELAGRAALAVENAQLHAAEREARKRAERATERMSRLQAITAGLSEAVTAEAVAAVIVDQGVAALGASTGILALEEEDGPIRVVRSVGVPDAIIERYAAFDRDAEIPLAEAMRTGEPVLVEARSYGVDRFPELATVKRLTGSQAVAAVPLRSGDQVIGALAFGYADDRAFDGADRGFLQALARQCSQALERAWLYETEHLAREAAEAASQAKSQFVAMMSHELRTPLSAILGYQELLAEGIVGPVNDRQRQQLDRIRASAAHLRDLINQILSLSRIEAGKEEVMREEVDLAGLVRDVAMLMEHEVEGKGLDLRVHVPTAVVIETDPGKVRQILLNLISNAMKFTDEGGIRVTLEATDEGVALDVSDTGIGIADADRHRIFDAFTQLDQSMTRRVGGSGLGLPVSRRLASLLGGTLELSSAPGQGSTFELRLPRQLPDLPEPEDEEAGEAGEDERENAAGGTPADGA